jgi:hypothetical protein
MNYKRQQGGRKPNTSISQAVAENLREIIIAIIIIIILFIILAKGDKFDKTVTGTLIGAVGSSFTFIATKKR